VHERPEIIALARLLAHPSPEVRDPAMDVLDRSGLPAITVLTAKLNHQEGSVRLDAVTALGEMGPKARAAVPALESRLKDKKGSVIQAAFEALKKIRGE
jgi:HEAT repeat protein